MEDGCRCVLPLFVYIDVCLALDELCDLLGALLTGEVRRGLLGHNVRDAHVIVHKLGGVGYRLTHDVNQIIFEIIVPLELV